MPASCRWWTTPPAWSRGCSTGRGRTALSTALAYLLYFRLLASAGATNLLLVTFLIPVTANLLGMLVLGESLEVRHIIGMALVGAGLAAIDGRVLKRVRRRRIEEPETYQGRDI